MASRSDEWVVYLRVSPSVWLGSQGDALFIGDVRSPRREVDLANPIGLLPLLERSFDKARSELRARAGELGLPADELLSRVPLCAVPRVAIESQMDYWVGRALRWLRQPEFTGVARPLLEVVVGSSWASQATRQEALRQLQHGRELGRGHR